MPHDGLGFNPIAKYRIVMAMTSVEWRVQWVGNTLNLWCNYVYIASEKHTWKDCIDECINILYVCRALVIVLSL